VIKLRDDAAIKRIPPTFEPVNDDSCYFSRRG